MRVSQRKVYYAFNDLQSIHSQIRHVKNRTEILSEKKWLSKHLLNVIQHLNELLIIIIIRTHGRCTLIYFGYTEMNPLFGYCIQFK